MDNIQQIYFNTGAPVAASTSSVPPPPPPPSQKKRGRQEIADDEDVVLIALSAEEITAKKLFICGLCHKGFIREQNLLVHQRAHDLPYNLPVKNKNEEKRKVYVCPETTCASHYRPKALCDLPSLKKHFKRKHGEKTMRCSKCSKSYAVKGDLRAHERICGTKDYGCECGSRFSRADNFMAHKTSCDAILAQNLASQQNKLQTSESTIGNNSISFFSNQPMLSSSSATSTSVHSFPFSSDTMVAPPVPNLSSLDQFTHVNMINDLANNTGIQSSIRGNTFDVHALHDTLFGVSSVPSNAFPDAGPQQGITWSHLEGTPACFFRSLENSPTIYSDQNNYSAYPNFNNTVDGNSHFLALENPDISMYQGNNMVLNLQGDYEGSTENENIFSSSLEDKAIEKGGLSGFGIHQMNQSQQFPGNG